MNLSEERERGAKASALLKNPLFVDALNIIRSSYFDAWRNTAIPEEGGNAFTSNYKSQYARTVTIHQLRQPLLGVSKQIGPIRFNAGIGGGTVYSVDLLDAFPVNTSAIELNNELDGLVQLTVSFAYTNWKRSSDTQGFINMDIDTPLGGIDLL